MKFLSVKARQALIVSVGGVVTWATGCTVLGHEGFYEDIVMPAVIKCLDGEDAHRLGVWMASKGLVPLKKRPDYPVLHTRVLGRDFNNPVGLAAGFDKDAEAMPGLLKLGFGFVEVGSVTPEPQPGNPRPRVFRLLEDKAVINRYGFNSCGHAPVLQRMQEFKQASGQGIVGVNLGKNKTSPDAAADYRRGAQVMAGVADYIVINVSSPNTPGLRALQGREHLERIVDQVHEGLKGSGVSPRPPLLLKISPDLSPQDRADIAAVATKIEGGVDGVIVSNTTVSRAPSLKGSAREETGGLSGAPLTSLALESLRDMYRLTGGRLPLVGVGGISSGAEAYERIRSGASLVQVYTALMYAGPPLVHKIQRELAALLKEDGFSSVSEAVGVDVKLSESSKS